MQPKLYHYGRPLARHFPVQKHVPINVIGRLCKQLCRWRSRFWGICLSPNINAFSFKVHHGYCQTVPSLAEYFMRRIRLEPNAMNTPPSRKVWLDVLEQRANRLHHSNFILLPCCQRPLDGRIQNHYKQYFQKLVTQGKISVFYCFVLIYTKMLTS